MGQLEVEVRRDIRNSKIQRAILNVVAAAGVLTVAAIAPNALKLLRLGNRRGNTEKSIQNAQYRLLKKGLLIFDGQELRLSSFGEQLFQKFSRDAYKPPKPKRWDGKWRVLIFDIKENRKSVRERLRSTLVSIGFQRAQDSVWVYPYDCEDFIMLLKADFKVGHDVLYLIVDKFENDTLLRKMFNL